MSAKAERVQVWVCREKGGSLLLVTSDKTEALRDTEPGDTLVSQDVWIELPAPTSSDTSTGGARARRLHGAVHEHRQPVEARRVT